jgi:hypothetical protein
VQKKSEEDIHSMKIECMQPEFISLMASEHIHVGLSCIRTSSLLTYIYFIAFSAFKISMKDLSLKKYTLKYRHSYMQLTGEITVACRQQPPPPFSQRKLVHVLLCVFVDMSYICTHTVKPTDCIYSAP